MAGGWTFFEGPSAPADKIMIGIPCDWIVVISGISRGEDGRQSGAILFQPDKRRTDYQGQRAVMPERPGVSIPILIGAAMIAAAILLSTLVTAVGTRFVGMESPSEDNLWLIDRLTGRVYRCQAAERGKASCEAELATGNIGISPKR